MEQGTLQGQPLTKLSPCDVKALQKCLQENNGDRAKCEKEVLAFQQACSSAATGRKTTTPAQS